MVMERYIRVGWGGWAAVAGGSLIDWLIGQLIDWLIDGWINWVMVYHSIPIDIQLNFPARPPSQCPQRTQISILHSSTSEKQKLTPAQPNTSTHSSNQFVSDTYTWINPSVHPLIHPSIHPFSYSCIHSSISIHPSIHIIFQHIISISISISISYHEFDLIWFAIALRVPPPPGYADFQCFEVYQWTMIIMPERWWPRTPAPRIPFTQPLPRLPLPPLPVHRGSSTSHRFANWHWGLANYAGGWGCCYQWCSVLVARQPEP